jgi:hypothetical protein
MNAVFGAILENFQKINIIFEETIDAFLKDRKQTGDSKEITVKEFLESFLPNSYCVKKAPIYDLLSSASNEIDCVILAPNHPRLITPKREVVVAEGVYAAIEVKPDISTLTDDSEFSRALKQVQSVKKLKRDIPLLLTEGNIPNEIKQIPCGIFSKKSCDKKRIVDFMKKKVRDGVLLKNELPDIVVTLDNGIIFHSTHIEHTVFSQLVKKQTSIHNGEKYILLETSNGMTLCFFLLLLLCVKSPEPLISDFIIKEYIKRCLDPLTGFFAVEP